MKKIAIIIPTYNETENIIELIRKIRNYVRNVIIYIVDDSPTPEIGKLINPNLKNVKYFYRKNKKGRGSAVLFGIKKALKDKQINLVIEMDADFSHNPNELKKNISFFKKKNLDMLIASRYLNSSKILNWSLPRKIFSFFSNKVARFFLNINIKDFTNGFRFYSIRSAKKIINKCGNIGDGFIILSEILVELYYNKFMVSETSSIFRNRVRGESSVNFNEIIKSFIGLIKIYRIKTKLCRK